MSDQRFLSSLTFDITIAYDEFGPSHGFPLVFLHAGALTRKMWQPQVDALSSVYHIFTVDLPGHGALAAHTFRLATAVEEVARIITEKVRGQALVVGLALGGLVTIALAQEHPDLVAGLVLAGCNIDTQGVSETVLKVRGALLEKSLAPAERLLTGVAEKTLSRLYPTNALQGMTGGYWKGAGQALQACAGKDFRTMLHTYRGPVLVLNGENDKNSRKSASQLDPSRENIAVRVISGAGHMCNVDRPKIFNNALRNFTQADLYHSYHYGYQSAEQATKGEMIYYEQPEMPSSEEMPE